MGIDADTAAIRRSFARLADVCRWDDARLYAHEASLSGWSPAQHVEHLMRSAGSILTLISAMAAGKSATPNTIASAAPKLAAADRPNVKGLASGLARIVCICAPASDRLAPTVTASSAQSAANAGVMAASIMAAAVRDACSWSCSTRTAADP